MTSIEVITGKPGSAEIESVKIINWHNPSDRKWLQSHMHWAMMNNASVGLRPRTQAKEQKPGTSRLVETLGVVGVRTIGKNF